MKSDQQPTSGTRRTGNRSETGNHCWSAAGFESLAGTRPNVRGARRRRGFTLAEVLAALAFMAIVIPVAVQALNVASLAGGVAVRKAEAARVAERLLNESLVTGSWSQSTQSGLITEQGHEFDWQLHNEAWSESPMRLISVQVEYVVQGKTYSVRLATLIDGAASLTPTSTTTTATTTTQ